MGIVYCCVCFFILGGQFGIREYLEENRTAIWLLGTSEDLNIIFLDIEDNGTGISAEISDQLFEPYTTTKEHGTGLGLTIVSQTISDHNGFTRFRNIESGGACFTIELPVN